MKNCFIAKGQWWAMGVFAIGVLCFIPAVASGQTSQSMNATGASVSTTTPKASTAVPLAGPSAEEPLAAGTTVIYSNFGTGTSLYNPNTGWTEAGLEANDEPIAEAMPFVSNGNYILTRLDAALTYVTGTNAVKFVLAEDNGGVPGKAMYVASFTGLPAFGTCCVVQTAKINPASSYVALKSGQTYWLYPVPGDTTAYIVWNYDTTNQGGDGAVSHDYGKTWLPAALDTYGTFDVYGVKATQ